MADYDNGPKPKKALSARQEKTLCDQQITSTKPGPILHDFAKMLRYVQENDILLSKTGLLPMKALRPLNEAMHRPLEVGLTRPHLQSLPNVEGLFMLLRASGLVRVEYKGKKRLLRIDDAMAADWEKLNEVEQFFCLLRIWSLWADPETVRNRCSSRCPILPEYLFFVTDIPRMAKDCRGDVMDYYQFRPGTFNVALAELFGLIATQQQPARKGQGWSVSRIETTAFGTSLCALLMQICPRLCTSFVATPEDYSFEQWQQHLAPYFPQLHRELELVEDEPTEGVHILTVSVWDSWRQLAVPQASSMSLLADAILDAFDFNRDHLYLFLIEDRFGSVQEYKHFYMDDPPYAHETSIGELGLQPGQRFMFRYDFGDNWEFYIVVDRIDPADPGMQEIRQLESHGAAPSQYNW